MLDDVVEKIHQFMKNKTSPSTHVLNESKISSKEIVKNNEHSNSELSLGSNQIKYVVIYIIEHNRGGKGHIRYCSLLFLVDWTSYVV